MQIYLVKDVSLSFSFKHVRCNRAQNKGKTCINPQNFIQNTARKVNKTAIFEIYFNVNRTLKPKVSGSKLNSFVKVNSGFQSMEKFNGITGIL